MSQREEEKAKSLLFHGLALESTFDDMERLYPGCNLLQNLMQGARVADYCWRALLTLVRRAYRARLNECYAEMNWWRFWSGYGSLLLWTGEAYMHLGILAVSLIRSREKTFQWSLKRVHHYIVRCVLP